MSRSRPRSRCARSAAVRAPCDARSISSARSCAPSSPARAATARCRAPSASPARHPSSPNPSPRSPRPNPLRWRPRRQPDRLRKQPRSASRPPGPPAQPYPRREPPRKPSDRRGGGGPAPREDARKEQGASWHLVFSPAWGDLRLAGPERRRQDDHPAHHLHSPVARPRNRRSPRVRHTDRPARGAQASRRGDGSEPRASHRGKSRSSRSRARSSTTRRC